MSEQPRFASCGWWSHLWMWTDRLNGWQECTRCGKERRR